MGSVYFLLGTLPMGPRLKDAFSLTLIGSTDPVMSEGAAAGSMRTTEEYRPQGQDTSMRIGITTYHPCEPGKWLKYIVSVSSSENEE